ncbi:MAG: chemotaxis response regulator protein-glutamate methylesterase [Flammeovirgaceae bacterium]
MKDKPIKVLVADDSGFMRLAMTKLLEEEGFMVVGTASNGKEAVEGTLKYHPDVVIIDWQMPDTDGKYAIPIIMEKFPVPIIVFSGSAQENEEEEALKLGAFSYIHKPHGLVGGNLIKVKKAIVHKIHIATGISHEKFLMRIKERKNNIHSFRQYLRYELIVIGASTGGTEAVEALITHLPIEFPIPIVIAQHIPTIYAYSFAERLNKISTITVTIPQEHEILVNGNVYILSGAYNAVLEEDERKRIRIGLTSELYPEYNHPSIDAMMCSAAKIFANKVIGLILSGMGKDGMLGMAKIFQAGGKTIAQDSLTSLIQAMPQAATQGGYVQHVLPLKEIPSFLIECVSGKK